MDQYGFWWPKTLSICEDCCVLQQVLSKLLLLNIFVHLALLLVREKIPTAVLRLDHCDCSPSQGQHWWNFCAKEKRSWHFLHPRSRWFLETANLSKKEFSRFPFWWSKAGRLCTTILCFPIAPIDHNLCGFLECKLKSSKHSFLPKLDPLANCKLPAKSNCSQHLKA